MVTRMRRPICAFVVRIWHKQVFSWRGSNQTASIRRLWCYNHCLHDWKQTLIEEHFYCKVVTLKLGIFAFVWKIILTWAYKWAAPSEFVTYRLCEQRRFRRACASAQSRQNLRCSLIQTVSQEEPSDRKPDPWPLWMAGHAQLKFVMTECSKTQIRLTGLKWCIFQVSSLCVSSWVSVETV